MLCKAVKNGPSSVYRRTHVTKCNNLLSFCCLGSAVLCLFDSNLPGFGCFDGSVSSRTTLPITVVGGIWLTTHYTGSVRLMHKKTGAVNSGLIIFDYAYRNTTLIGLLQCGQT